MTVEAVLLADSGTVFDKSEGMHSFLPPISAARHPAVCSLFSESHFLSLFSLRRSVKHGKDALFASLIRCFRLVTERHVGLERLAAATNVRGPCTRSVFKCLTYDLC